ncbi:MAG: serine hydrolase, partial [Planctomycetes bacterium]|nr:serine hydrolase [Planctomycetota bacterium]
FEEESYDSATLYYCRELHAPTLSFAVAHPPGTTYRYGSINVQLLWEVLHRQLGGRTVAQYFEERVWRRLGAERAATWSLDSEQSGIEKLFAGLNATTRDLARLGLLFLHRGRWNGTQVVSPEWVARSIEPDPVAGVQTTVDGLVRRGRYQWFLTCDGSCFFAKGYRGQYLWVDPAARTVVVRIGEGHGSLDWPALFRAVADGPPPVADVARR